MQIIELVIYGKNGKRRLLKFNLGTVNIITGKSKSGKSAIGSIIEYCLGNKECNIADGVIREKISWYGLLLQLEDCSRVFVARMNPELGKMSSECCYLETGMAIESPKNADFVSNANLSSIVEFLSKRIGIEDNINIPNDGQTRAQLKTNIRHSLFLCFQNQDEIASKNNLFHNQSKPFVILAIKDSLKYFLGATSQNALLLDSERKKLKKEYDSNLTVLNNRNNSKKELSIGLSLLEEAISCGLIEDNLDIDKADFKAIYNLLKSISFIGENNNSDSQSDKLIDLQDEYRILSQELSQIREKIHEARQFQGYSYGFKEEIQHQKQRLESIGLFEKFHIQNNKCPFCDSQLDTHFPSISAMKESIKQLESDLGNIQREAPRLQEYLNSLVLTYDEIKDKRKIVEFSIQNLYDSDERLERIRELNSKRAVVFGRISLWIERYYNDLDYSKYEKRQKEISSRLTQIEELLSGEGVKAKIDSASSQIQMDMTKWAEQLELEGKGNPYRIDFGKATVFMDKDYPISLQKMGSGSNWVGVHIIAIMALHKYFITHNRPVPRFVFLDQPSQVYFPSKEKNDANRDSEAVKRIYRFLIDHVSSLDKKMQIIIVDHAYFSDKYFSEHVIENWNKEEDNLVPSDWI